MLHVMPDGISRMRATGFARPVCVGLLALVAAACGAGSGTERELPAGPPTSAPLGNKVLYASMGRGNLVAAYRLGADGLLTLNPFSRATVENPRRLLLNDGVLFVALNDRIVSFELAPDGSLPPAPTATTDPILESNPLDFVIADDVLYVAFENLLTVNAYPLQQGQVFPIPLSISGTGSSDYRSITAGDGFIYAGQVNDRTVDTYLVLPAGALDEEPEPQDPEPDIDLPEALLFNDGVLYVADAFRARILTFPVQANGLLPEEPTSETRQTDSYAELAMANGLIYASAFNRGRIDLFQVNPIDGTLPEEGAFAFTEEDAGLFPTGIVIDSGVLYVAAAGRDRIDAYILSPTGVPTTFPSSSTFPIVDSFPNDIEIGDFSP
jgi:hypothetical protein